MQHSLTLKCCFQLPRIRCQAVPYQSVAVPATLTLARSSGQNAEETAATQRHIKIVASFINRRPVAVVQAHHRYRRAGLVFLLTWHPRQEGAGLHLAASWPSASSGQDRPQACRPCSHACPPAVMNPLQSTRAGAFQLQEMTQPSQLCHGLLRKTSHSSQLPRGIGSVTLSAK